MNRKLFAQIKSKCKTKSQMRAFNELVSTFADKYVNSSKEAVDIVLDAIKADQGELESGKSFDKWVAKLTKVLGQFIKANKVTKEDLVNIVQDDVDSSEEAYGNFKGYDEVNEVMEEYFNLD